MIMRDIDLSNPSLEFCYKATIMDMCLGKMIGNFFPRESNNTAKDGAPLTHLSRKKQGERERKGKRENDVVFDSLCIE